MKQMKDNILYILLFIIVSFGIEACDKETEEPKKPSSEQPGDNENEADKSDYKIYSYFKPLIMSCHKQTNIIIAELRSDVSDFMLNCEVPDGYKVTLCCEDEKDSHGFYVYRVYADIPDERNHWGDMYEPIPSTDAEQYANYKFKLTFNGNFVRNGKREPTIYKLEVPIKRYFGCSQFFLKNWTLVNYRIIPFQDLMKWNDEIEYYDINDGTNFNYTTDNSPLKVVKTYPEKYLGGGVTAPGSMEYSCTVNLFGWPKKNTFNISAGQSDNYYLINSEANHASQLLDISVLSLTRKEIYTDHDGVYWDVTLVCSTNEYDKTGNLIAQHIYTFKCKE